MPPATATATRRQRLHGAERHAHLGRRRRLPRLCACRCRATPPSRPTKRLTLTLSSRQRAPPSPTAPPSAPSPTTIWRRCRTLSVADATVERRQQWRERPRFYRHPVGCGDRARSPWPTPPATARRRPAATTRQPAVLSTFAAGETSKVVHVLVGGDTAVETNETPDAHAFLAQRRHCRRRHGHRHHHQRRPPRAPADDQHLRCLGGRGQSRHRGRRCARPAGSAPRATRSFDSASHSVQIAGVNWFGFEILEPGAARPVDARLPGHDEPDEGARVQHDPPALLQRHASTAPAPNRHRLLQEPRPAGPRRPCRSWTRSSAYAGEIGLKIILDHHRNDSGVGPSPNGLWYDAQHTPKRRWVSDWQMLADGATPTTRR